MASRRNNFASHLKKAHKRILPDVGEVDCLPLLKQYNGTPEHGNESSEHKSGEAEVINRYLSKIDAVPLSEIGNSTPVAIPTLESLQNSEGMNVPTLENCDSDFTVNPQNVAKELTPGTPVDGPTLSDVIKGEAESILSRVLGGNQLATENQLATKNQLTQISEPSEQSDSVTGTNADADQEATMTNDQEVTRKSRIARRKHECQKCDFTAEKRSHLAYHEKTEHEGMEDLRSHKCGMCSYSAKRVGQVTEHRRRVHERVKRFKCRDCRVHQSCYCSFGELLSGVGSNTKN